MKREARRFEFGAPHFYQGISYSWPNHIKDYDTLLNERKEELAPILQDKLREYIKEFKVHTFTPHYPYIQIGMTGFVLHLGDSGRWLEVCKNMGIWFLVNHNLDSYADRAARFNVGSDTLELLDDSILAPRILIQEGKYVLKYPLPAGTKTIDDPLLNQKSIDNLVELVGWKDAKLVIGENKRKIEYAKGIITIQDGICEGRGFEGFDNPKASFIISKLMSLT